MKLIIDIPEENYENGTLVNYFNCYSKQLDEIIYNGIPLPKEHGDLIDSDKMIKELNERIQIFDESKNEILKQLGEPEENHQIPLWLWKGCCITCGIIIEADKEE